MSPAASSTSSSAEAGARPLRRSRFLPLAFAGAAIVALVGGCGGGYKASTVVPTTVLASDSPKTAPAAAATAPKGVIGDAATVVPTFGPVGNETVAFQTDDGVNVRGHFYAASGPKRKVVILARQNGSDQKSWAAYAGELASQGIAALTFDFRGFGETGGTRDITKIDHDLEAAVRFIRSRDYPQVYVVGASMGGTAALKVAARQDVAGVVAVSAPVSFEGLNAQPDVAGVKAPKLFIATTNDPNGATASVQALLAAATGSKDSEVYEGTAHGTEILQSPAAAAFKARLLAFLQK